jgi:flagellar basal body rod protein FlgF
MIGRLFTRESFDIPCTIEVEHSFDSLHAHVELDGDIKIYPGDEVLVHGEPIVVPYGEKQTIRRNATVTRASAIERAWTRATGDLEFMELCEFSFSSGRKL